MKFLNLWFKKKPGNGRVALLFLNTFENFNAKHNTRMIYCSINFFGWHFTFWNRGSFLWRNILLDLNLLVQLKSFKHFLFSISNFWHFWNDSTLWKSQGWKLPFKIKIVKSLYCRWGSLLLISKYSLAKVYKSWVKLILLPSRRILLFALPLQIIEKTKIGRYLNWLIRWKVFLAVFVLVTLTWAKLTKSKCKGFFSESGKKRCFQSNSFTFLEFHFTYQEIGN
jgi:hypothetical protein